MKTISLTLINVLMLFLVLSCETETEELGVAQNKTNSNNFISGFEGSFLLNQSCSVSGSDILTLTTKIKGNDLLIVEFDGITVEQKFELSNTSEPTIEYVGDNYQVQGFIENNQVKFKVQYFNIEYCSIDFTLDELFSFKGSYELFSVKTNRLLKINLGNLINGTVVLTSINDLSTYDFFKIGSNEINFSNNDFAIRGKIIDGSPFIYAIDAGGDKYYTKLDLPKELGLRGSNNKFVSSENGRKPMFANRNRLLSWENFEIVELGGNRIALRANNGRYVSFSTGHIRANKTSIGLTEVFTVLRVNNSSAKVALLANNGRYISTENGFRGMTANRSAIGPWETFIPVKK
ncbi:hypothetical protein GCM10009430_32110 [Aquimarina litoralis]|uniref:DUF7910 domain-containing protein n=1 Tax=Aquimarina litoralis TaxID=584605 RepID=A0ABN1J296_9FLAO